MMLTKPGTEVDGKGLCVVSGFVSEWTMAPSDDWSGASFTASFVDGSKVRFAQAMRLTRRVLLTHWLAFVAGVAVAFLSK